MTSSSSEEIDQVFSRTAVTIDLPAPISLRHASSVLSADPQGSLLTPR
jgi:hypothetical protein